VRRLVAQRGVVAAGQLLGLRGIEHGGTPRALRSTGPVHRTMMPPARRRGQQARLRRAHPPGEGQGGK
jgi:hypothetical protein